MPLPKLLVTGILFAANTALSMLKKIEGPRLDDLKFQGGDPGSPWMRIWGTRRTFGVPIWARDLTEVKQQRKTKGGKYNDYTYYADFAVGLTSHEIDAVRRLWLDKKLVYDLSGAGPITPFDFGGTGLVEDFLGIYLGTADQDPDPYMQALVEADFGVGFCPAYRNRSYVVLKHFPVEKFGNRFPQLEAEVVRNKTNLYPHDSLDFGAAGGSPVFSSDYSTLTTTDLVAYRLVDVAARALLYSGDLSPGPREIYDCHAYLSDGSIIYGTSGNNVVSQAADGGASVVLFHMESTSQGTASSASDGDGNDHYCVNSVESFYFDGIIVAGLVPGGLLFTDTDGDVWLVGKNVINTATIAIFRRMTGIYKEVTATLPSSNTHPLAFHYSDDTHDHFILAWGGVLYLIDRETGTILDSRTPNNPANIWLPSFNAIAPGAPTFWIGFEEISSIDLSSVRQLDRRDWVGGSDPNSSVIYDPVNHALIDGFNTGNPKVWYYLDRIGENGMTLGDIEAEIADLCGIEAYDFSAHTQIVPGWSMTQGQASNAIEPLHNIFDATIRPHDFSIQGINYTGTTGGTILTERFVRQGDTRYSVKIRQAAELPREITINFADNAQSQQTNNVMVDRHPDATGARGVQSIDLTTFACDVDTIRGYAERYFRRIWSERREVSLGLTAQHLALEPGDLRTLDLDGQAAVYRYVKSTIRADDVIETEWKYDSATLASLDGTGGAAFDRDEEVIQVALLSKGFFLDIPYTSDADAQTTPIIYFGAAPLTEGSWTGAIGYQSIDGEYTEEISSVPSSSPTTWGYVSSALPGRNTNLWDRTSSVTVVLQTGALTGCTEAQIDANPLLNLAAIQAGDDWEMVNFTTATLTATKTYTVSGFKRGRRGTEWAAGLHNTSDMFLLLDNVHDAKMGLSEVGTDLSFKAITAGRTTGFPVDVVPYTGASLKPYAPCHLRGLKDSGSGDWALAWVRRTRVGGAWTSGATIPVSETSEAYEVEIMNGASVVRTVTGLSSPATTWTAAQQTTDFGFGQSSVTFRVYQISDAVGRGFVASGTA